MYISDGESLDLFLAILFAVGVPFAPIILIVMFRGKEQATREVCCFCCHKTNPKHSAEVRVCVACVYVCVCVCVCVCMCDV